MIIKVIVTAVSTLFGWKGDPHFNPFHIAGFILMYVRLARKEEKDVIAEFGDEYRRYATQTPAFIPGFRNKYHGRPR